jgi:hypothetical protein
MATMSAEVSFDRALAAVADGESIDWEALERLPRDPADRQRVHCLRLLAEIGAVHRSTVDPLESATAPTPAPAPAATRAPSPRPTPAPTPALYTSMTDTVEGASGPRNAEQWGRYRLVQKVGAGGFGQVYRAWDADLEREVAIKLLHQHISDDHAGRRVRQEGKALAKISQSNVVAVHGVEVHQGRAGLCMEFVRGQTLEDVVRTRGAFGEREAMIIGEDVCRALSAVHRNGYLHRDVKARNVMREQAGRIVLMDFGTGRETQQGPEAVSDLTGTPIYMAPEVLEGRPASVRSDVYSVGVLLFYLVSGAHPVQARSSKELKAAHREGRRRYLSEWRSDLTADFVRVVDRAIAPKPEDRYPNAAALFEALGRVLSRLDPPPPSPRWLWPRRIAVASLVAFALVAAMGTLTSASFNVTLGRAEFANETFWERLRWGLKACVPPLFVLVLAWLAFAVVLSIWRVAAGLSPRIRAIDERIRQRLSRLAADPTMLASGVLLVSAVLLVAAWAWFRDLLTALTEFVRFAPSETIAILGPEFSPYHDLYNLTFSVMFVVTLGAWLAVRRAAQAQRATLARGTVAGVIVVAGLQLASLGIAYRLLIHNELSAMALGGEVCYVTGERADRLLLFCPSRETDRNQVVRRGDPGLTDLHRTESLFTGVRTGGSHAR